MCRVEGLGLLITARQTAEVAGARIHCHLGFHGS